MNSVSTPMKRLRKRYKLSAAHVAHYSRSSVAAIRRYENGEVLPPLDKAERIAALLNWNGKLSDLFRIE